MRRKKDLRGQRFGRLVVIAKDKLRKYHYLCQCACGKCKIISGYSLQNGLTKSCGCLRKEKTKERSITHGMCGTSTYKSWSNMLQRCNNINNSDYQNYGGCGITVCQRWSRFENFFEDMGKRPDNLTIDRIKNNLGYFKENCRWATEIQQARNRQAFKNNKTGVIGVFWNNRCQKYVAQISVNKKQVHIGYFMILEEAATARQKAEQEYWG